MVKIAASLLVVAAAVQANPIFRRQAVSSATEALSSVVESATAAVSSAVQSASAVASGSGLPGSASASASSSAAPLYPGYPCQQGDLTYVEQTMAYPGVQLETAVTFLSNWAQAVPYPIVNSTGTNETGATRTYDVMGLNVTEVLVNQTITPEGFLISDSNVTSPISAAGITIYSAANHLEYYTNSTNGESTAKVFSNFCASDQAAGTAFLTQFFQQTLMLYGQALAPSGSMSGSMMPSMSASMMPPPPSGGVASSVAGGAAGAASSATAGAGGAVSSATAGAGGALSSATAGAAGALSTATQAVASVV